MIFVIVEKCNIVDLVFIYDYDIEGVSFFLGREFLNVVLNIKVYIVNFFIEKKCFLLI